MLLAVGLSLGLPAEDVLDAVYDEAETLPYEVIPLFSAAMRPVAVRTTQAPVSSLHLKAGVRSLFLPARARSEAHRFADAPALSALLCILLC